jgi:hypothetical protein
MRSLIRFDVVDRPLVGQATDYSTLGLDADVVDGALTALIVEVEHDEAATVAEVSLAAREKLRNLMTLMGLGQGREPVLGAIRFKSLLPEMQWGIVGIGHTSARAAVSRGLSSMPAACLVNKLDQDPRLRRQLECLSSARTTEDTITKIRYAYQVLEQEEFKGSGYKPADDFRHVRNAVSHPELRDPNAHAFFQLYLCVNNPDLRNTKHMAFLAQQCELLMQEAIRLCEAAIPKFWS